MLSISALNSSNYAVNSTAFSCSFGSYTMIVPRDSI
jgi:hypothetical protein